MIFDGILFVDVEFDEDGEIISVIEEVDTSFIEEEEKEINNLLKSAGVL